ncbi:DUF6101 family protein [uncultured Bartonella sp.]|uniref:DUF6101 family protein n=1 Tax=uncultured Bartonella sp. TaxID=104108 RepID=UPI0026074AD8|nr:DUF6101 family protein [uncultured Bartonella sp.]
MATQWANRATAGLELRLDPCHLPQCVSFDINEQVVVCSLNEHGASLKTEDGTGSSQLSRLLPAHHFKGIAARAVKTKSGHKAVSLELLHKNYEISIPLLVSRDLDDVLLDWRLWADTYDLPMLLVNDNGSVIPVKDRSPMEHFFGKKPHMQTKRSFLLRCRGTSLGIRLVIANQVMLG